MSAEDKKRAELENRMQAYAGVQIGPPEIARDAVNEAMIHHWCDVLGDHNPAYTNVEIARKSRHGGLVAPPMMMHAWVLPGIDMANPEKQPSNEQRGLHQLLTDAGYPSVVATNTEQRFHRYLRPGDRIQTVTRIESISEQKATALGIGYFINTRDVFTDQNGEEVGWMTFRVLKFRPAQKPEPVRESSTTTSKPTRIRPPMGHENGWWWEAIERGELRIQKCASCGTLRHPPRPMCGKCQCLEWETITSTGRGTVYSYTIMHHPKFPGFEFPFACGLVALEEGTRIVSNIVGCKADEVHIGMPVELSIESVDEDMKLPFFRPAK